MKRLVWALHGAYSSLVSNHLVINNKIQSGSEWSLIQTEETKKSYQTGAGSFDHFYSVTGRTRTHRQTLSHGHK